MPDLYGNINGLLTLGAGQNVRRNQADTDFEVYNSPSVSEVATAVASGQVQSDWSASSGPSRILNKPTLATVATSGSYNDLADKPTIPTTPSRSFASPTRSLNSSFQISTTRDAIVNYSVDISSTLSLTTGQTGTAFLEYADNSGFTTNVVEICRFVNGNTGTLAVGLGLTQNVTGGLNGVVPANKYVRIRTTGTATATFRSGQEVLL